MLTFFFIIIIFYISQHLILKFSVPVDDEINWRYETKEGNELLNISVNITFLYYGHGNAWKWFLFLY